MHALAGKRSDCVKSVMCAFPGIGRWEQTVRAHCRTIEHDSRTRSSWQRDMILVGGWVGPIMKTVTLLKKNERSLFIIILRGRGGVGVGWFGAIETAGFFVYIYIYIFYLNVCGFRFVVAHLSLCIIHFYTRCLWKNWLLDVTNRGVKRVFFLLFNVCYFPLMYLLHWILSTVFFRNVCCDCRLWLVVQK